MSVCLPDHLDLIAAAPGGIQKLRGLILELAVRGKIVPVDKSQSVLTTLGDIGKWAVGSGFPTTEQGKVGLEILFAKVSDMNLPENSKFITRTNHTISRESAKRLRVNIHPAGTVVFPKIGGAIATNKRRVLAQDTAIDNNCLGITPKKGVDSEWLFVLLSSIDLTKYQAGTSVPALAQGVLSEIPVILPPVAEQHRIVAKVDELMALCDRLEAEQADSASAHARLIDTLLATLTQSTDAADLATNWQRLAEHFDTLFTTETSLDTLKQTILQLAVMGKLVPQDSNDEPASELLKRIAKERVQLESEGICKKSKPLPALEMEEQPYPLPAGWLWVYLSDVCHVITDGEHITPAYEESGIPMLSAKHLGTDALLFNDLKYVSPSVAEKCWSRCCPEERDILVVSRGGGVGRTIISGTHGYCLMGSVLLFKPATTVSEHYLRSYLCSNLGNEKLRSTSGASAQPAIYIAHLKRDFVLPLPPLVEQHRIVAKIDELIALCDRLKDDLTTTRQQQTNLADALIENALEAA